MRLLAWLRRLLDRWCLDCEDAIRLEHSRRHQERIAREHLFIAARLEAVQVQVSFRARARMRISKHSTEVIPFPWRLR